MNYSSLNNLSPSYFRPIGYLISSVSLLYGLYSKLFIIENIEHNSFLVSQVVFLIGLLLVLSAKVKIEDERIISIRQQVWNHGYWLLLGYLISIILLVDFLNGDIGSAETLSLLIGIALVQTVVFEIAKNNDLLEWMEKNKTLYHLVLLISLSLFYFFYKWFWYA